MCRTGFGAIDGQFNTCYDPYCENCNGNINSRLKYRKNKYGIYEDIKTYL